MSSDLLDDEIDLDSFVDPLVKQIEVLDVEIDRLANRVTALRTKRIKYRALLRALDPSKVKPLYKPNSAGKNGSKKKGKGAGTAAPSAQKMDEIRAWLTANKDLVNGMQEGLGAYATGLCETPGFPLVGQGQQSRCSKALRMLQDEGFLRLDNVHGIGGRKNYKVV